MTTPDKIYAAVLNGHVTMAWSDWREDKTDIEYIRADIHEAQIAALHTECDRLTRYLGKVPNKDAEESYDLIDRYLRNNLDDPEYATMSAALEACYGTLLCPQNDRLTAMLGPQKPTKAGEVPDA